MLNSAAERGLHPTHEFDVNPKVARKLAEEIVEVIASDVAYDVLIQACENSVPYILTKDWINSVIAQVRAFEIYKEAVPFVIQSGPEKGNTVLVEKTWTVDEVLDTKEKLIAFVLKGLSHHVSLTDVQLTPDEKTTNEIVLNQLAA